MPDKSGVDVGKGCFLNWFWLVCVCLQCCRQGLQSNISKKVDSWRWHMPDNYGLDSGKGCFFDLVLFGLCLYAELRARQAKQDKKKTRFLEIAHAR